MAELGQDHIINLLNGFGSGNDDVFLDEDGMPTDRFLQALKSDSTRVEGAPTSSSRRRSPPRPHPAAPSSSIVARTKIAAAALRPPPPPMPTQHNVKGHEYLMIRRQEYATNPSLEHEYLAQQREDDEVRRDAEQYGYGMDDDYNVGVDTDGYGWGEDAAPRAPQVLARGANASPPQSHSSAAHDTKRRKPIARKKKVAPAPPLVDAVRPRSAPAASRPPAAGKQTTHRGGAPLPAYTTAYDTSPTAEEKAGDADLDLDLELDHDGLAAETRSRTLRLRLQGQQNAIRALEAQLAEALEHLESRNAQLAVASRQLAVLQPAAVELRRKAQAANADQQKSVALRRDELLERYRSQIDLLQARLAEEKTQRGKDAERFKAMKDYGERAKVRCKEFEDKVGELTAALAEIHGKLQKYRKEYKDGVAEIQGGCYELCSLSLSLSHSIYIHISTLGNRLTPPCFVCNTTALRAAVNERDTEITRQRSRCDKAEASLRNANMDIERYREELRNQVRRLFVTL